MSIRLGGDERRPASSHWPRIHLEGSLTAGRLLVDRIRSAVTGRDEPEEPARARLLPAR